MNFCISYPNYILCHAMTSICFCNYYSMYIWEPIIQKQLQKCNVIFIKLFVVLHPFYCQIKFLNTLNYVKV